MPGSNVWKYKRIAAGIIGILMLLIMPQLLIAMGAGPT